jgi:hypothetical protein
LRLVEKSMHHRWRRPKHKTWLYLLENTSGNELLLGGKGEEVTIRRIERVRSFVYNYLWKFGKAALFDTAVTSDDDPAIKDIRVFLIGLGKTGMMMLRSLVWFCQMDGYRLSIDVFDRAPLAESRLRAACPELLDNTHNDHWHLGDAQYRIRFHSDVDTSSDTFSALLDELDYPTFVFISLGDDDTNIEVAQQLRMQLLRKSRLDGSFDEGLLDSIHVVVHDSRRAHALSHDRTLKRVGGFEGVYSYETILDQELEKKAESVHTYWYQNDPSKLKAAREEYWHKEYYRNSSMAEVIHKEVRDALLAETELRKSDAEQVEALAILEHRRWLAYMRSEGFIFSGSTDEGSRCDDAKLHNLLVPYNQLPEAEKKLSFDA